MFYEDGSDFNNPAYKAASESKSYFMEPKKEDVPVYGFTQDVRLSQPAGFQSQQPVIQNPIPANTSRPPNPIQGEGDFYKYHYGTQKQGSSIPSDQPITSGLYRTDGGYSKLLNWNDSGFIDGAAGRRRSMEQPNDGRQPITMFGGSGGYGVKNSKITQWLGAGGLGRVTNNPRPTVPTRSRYTRSPALPGSPVTINRTIR